MSEQNGSIDLNKTYLITGAAGFIGYHLAKKLASQGASVVGYDNINDYYDVNLKYARLKELEAFPGFAFVKGDLADAAEVDALFEKYRPEVVVNLGAQAGVRYSITNPKAYVDSNIVGFFNILEACRRSPVDHLVYASSSSVYGNQQKTPFSTSDRVDEPVSLYAATKKSNELFAYSYAHLYGIPCTGLRFFTVYGPYGRPDMAAFIFTRKMFNGEPIQIFNNGDMYRDFTYVDDIIQGIENVLRKPPEPNAKGDRAKVYNIGANRPEKLLDLIETLERLVGKEAKKEFLPMQPGDVYQTYADVDDLVADFGFKPQVDLQTGLKRFVDWYREFYRVD
ncbi:MAG: NAD-dependent epimerase [Thermoguttaceae bacterium]|nr:NAD-dependent epimerase [Thermoguttaceae bacterium]